MKKNMKVTSHPSSLPSCSALPATLRMPWLGTVFSVEVSHQFLTSVRADTVISTERSWSKDPRKQSRLSYRERSPKTLKLLMLGSLRRQCVEIRLHL